MAWIIQPEILDLRLAKEDPKKENKIAKVDMIAEIVDFIYRAQETW